MAYMIHVYGRVQGVGFRYSVKGFAKNHNLVGYVTNLPDGSVEILADGTENNLDQLITYCKNGPSFARVDRVETEKITPHHKNTEFRIQ